MALMMMVRWLIRRENNRFFLLWVSKALSEAIDWIHYFALIFYTHALTGSMLATGMALVFGSIPSLLLSHGGSVLASRRNCKFIIMVSNFLSFFLALFIGLRAFHGSPTVYEIYVVAFLMGGCKAFFRLVLAISISIVVPANELNIAHSLARLASNITEIAGPLVGGAVIALYGAPMAFVANGVLFLAAAVTGAFISIPHQIDFSARGNLLNLRENLKYIKKNQTVRPIIFVMIMVVFFARPMPMVLKVLLHEYYQIGSLGLGFLVGASAIGTLLTTSYLVARPTWLGRTYMFLGFPAVSGIILVLVGWIQNFYVAIGLMFLEGLVGGLGEITFSILIQLAVPDQMQRRVFRSFSTVTAMVTPLSFAVAGVALEKVGVQTILSIGGFALVAGGLTLFKNALQTMWRGGISSLISTSKS
ncbi:MAG: MFS transporter [Firmicutes bacterium]|nr:MFS transporter [Bacillota bacterium]